MSAPHAHKAPHNISLGQNALPTLLIATTMGLPVESILSKICQKKASAFRQGKVRGKRIMRWHEIAFVFTIVEAVKNEHVPH